MSVSFTRAPTVAAGDAITSTQLRSLARAFNDRLRSGIGDPTFRIQQYFFNLARQFRNPASNGLSFPSLAEWFEYYIHLAPGFEWAGIGDPGDYEGANLASLLGAFVFGNPSVESEADRTNVVALDPTGSTLQDYWELGKKQRGGYDPTTGNQWVPALTAAESHFRIVQPQGSFHGKSWGGYLPLPTKLGDCGDEDQTPNYQYRFTSLIPGLPDKVYPGSCPSWTPGYDPSHVQGIWSGPLAYYVFFGNGNFERLAKAQYIEGPYSAGGALAKCNGDQLERLGLNAFAKEYRGTAVQRIGEYDIEQIAFDFERFLTTQYLLAPAKASMVGTQLDIVYPVLTFSAVTDGSESTEHTLTSGFVLGGIFVRAVNLPSDVRVNVVAGTTTLSTLSLAPDAGTAYAVQYWPNSPTAPTVKLVLVGDATGATITAEVAELLEMKPQFTDYYLLLRMATALPSIDDVDRRGIDEGKAAKVLNDYERLGCVVPQNGAVAVNDQVTQPDSNPVYDAARRLVRKHSRIVKRQQFIGYELDASGRSVLYFRKSPGPEADSFEDISDAIAHSASAEGRTNEWTMFIQTKVYHPAAGNIWRPDVYGDYFAWNNRAMFYSSEITKQGKPMLLRHITAGPPYITPVLAPEAGTGYNFAENTNSMRYLTAQQKEWAYRSFQIYAPDYEIHSAETVTLDGSECVKITMTGRLRHCESAPASIALDVGSWDVPSLRAEPYRTDENALREYLVWLATSVPAPVKLGDSSVSTNISTIPLYGSVLPHFFFTHLVPEPYEDANDEQDPTDTICDVDDFQQMEIYLRSMCEGYVDDVTTGAYACANQIETAFDYTFENLCYQAFGGRWFTVLPESEREDNPWGFGPMPDTLMYADVFNQFSSAVNKLTRVRVMLPHKLEVFQKDFEGEEVEAWSVGGAGKFIKFDASPPAAETPVLPETWEWIEPFDDVIVSTAVSFFTGSYNVDGDPYLRTDRFTMDWRFSLNDPLAVYALPEAWRAQYAMLGGGFVGRYERQITLGYATPDAGPSDCGSLTDYWTVDGTDYEVSSRTNIISDCLVYGAGGVLDVGTPGTADIALGGDCNTQSYISDAIVPVSRNTGILTVALA